jgi:hypothetical protein
MNSQRVGLVGATGLEIPTSWSRTTFLAFLLLSTISYPLLRSATCQNTIGNRGTPNSSRVGTTLRTMSLHQEWVTQCTGSNSWRARTAQRDRQSKEGPSLLTTKSWMGGNASGREYCRLRNRELANRWLFALHNTVLIIERQAFSRGLRASG